MSAQPAAPSEQNRLLAALAYPVPFLIALVIILTDLKKDSYMRYHGWTALFWHIAWTVVMIILGVLNPLPLIGWLFRFTGWLFRFAWIVLSVFFAIEAYNQKAVVIPVVSDWARKFITTPEKIG